MFSEYNSAATHPCRAPAIDDILHGDRKTLYFPMTALFKIITLTAFCAIANVTMAADSSAPATTGELRVSVKGLSSNKGRVRFKLFHTEDTYTRQEDAFREEFVVITDRTSEWLVKDIPPQDYAVVIYHDENNNEEFDKNFLGIPKEAYGFSNNVRPKLAQPSYADVKFRLVPPVTSTLR